MRLHLSLTSLLATATLLAGAGTATAADCTGTDLRPAADNMSAVAASTLCLINNQRAAAGLKALAEQPQLDASSLAHSQDMVIHNYFAHNTPSGGVLVERLAAAGYTLPDSGGWAAGENIAWGSGTLSTPAQIVDAWMHSEGHRANILDADYREIGLGIVAGAPGVAGQAATYTTDFGMHPTATTSNRASTTTTTAVAASKKAATAKSAAAKRARTCSKLSKAAKAKHASKSARHAYAVSGCAGAKTRSHSTKH